MPAAAHTSLSHLSRRDGSSASYHAYLELPQYGSGPFGKFLVPLGYRRRSSVRSIPLLIGGLEVDSFIRESSTSSRS